MHHAEPCHRSRRECWRQLAAKCDQIISKTSGPVHREMGPRYDELRAQSSVILVPSSPPMPDRPMRTTARLCPYRARQSRPTYLAGPAVGVPVVHGLDLPRRLYVRHLCAIRRVVALQARQTSGEAQCIALALYESLFRVARRDRARLQNFGLRAASPWALHCECLPSTAT